MPSNTRNLVNNISDDDAPLKTGAGLAGFGKPVTPLTVTPVNPPTRARVTFGFKCDPAVRRQFARFVKWYNRDADPADETDAGQLAERALVRFMAAEGYKETTP